MLQRAVSSRDFCRPKPQLKGSTCRNPQSRSKTLKYEREWVCILVPRLQHSDCTSPRLSRYIPLRPQEEQQRRQNSESNVFYYFHWDKYSSSRRPVLAQLAKSHQMLIREYFFACEGGKQKKLQSYWTVVSICQGINTFILDILVENKRRKTGWMKSKLWHVLIMQSNIWDALDLSFYNNEKKVEGSLQDVKFAPFSGLIKVRLTLQLQFLSNFSTGMNQVSWI